MKIISVAKNDKGYQNTQSHKFYTPKFVFENYVCWKLKAKS